MTSRFNQRRSFLYFIAFSFVFSFFFSAQCDAYEECAPDISFFKESCCSVEELSSMLSRQELLEYDRASFIVSSFEKKLQMVKQQRASLLDGRARSELLPLDELIAAHELLYKAFHDYLFRSAFFFFVAEHEAWGLPIKMIFFHRLMLETFSQGAGMLLAGQEHLAKKQIGADAGYISFFYDLDAHKNAFLVSASHFAQNFFGKNFWSVLYTSRYSCEGSSKEKALSSLFLTLLKENKMYELSPELLALVKSYIRLRFTFCYKQGSFISFAQERIMLLDEIQRLYLSAQEKKEVFLEKFFYNLRDYFLTLSQEDSCWPDYYVTPEHQLKERLLALTFSHIVTQQAFKQLEQQADFHDSLRLFKVCMLLYFNKNKQGDLELLNKAIFLHKQLQLLQERYKTGWLAWFFFGDSSVQKIIDQMVYLVAEVITDLQERLYPARGLVASLLSGDWFKGIGSDSQAGFMQSEQLGSFQALLKNGIGNAKVATLPVITVAVPPLLIALLRKYGPSMPESVRKNIELSLENYMKSGDLASLLAFVFRTPEITQECKKESPELFATLQKYLTDFSQEKEGAS